MSEFTFKGTTPNPPFNLWDNETILSANGQPPPALPIQTPPNRTSNVRSVDLENQPIMWSTINSPSFIENLSFNRLISSASPLQNVEFEIGRNVVLTIESGIQGNILGSRPQSRIYYIYEGGFEQEFDLLVQTDTRYCIAPNTAACPTERTGLSNIFGKIDNDGLNPPQQIDKIQQVQVLPWNEGGSAGASNQTARNMTITMYMEVTLTVKCNNSDLNNGFCLNYCNIPSNQKDCFNPYLDYCLNTQTNNEPNIFSSSGCRIFFADYIKNIGTNAQIDIVLIPYCSGKYPGFDDLTNSGNETDIEICACNLKPELYIQLWDNLIKDFPGYAGITENERCLFPSCDTSPFKNMFTGNVCLVPQCVNIASIDNEGNIGGVTVKQTGGKCADITGSGTPSNGGSSFPSEAESFIQKHWVWIVLGIGILLVLIIAILIVVAGESNKPKKK